MMYTGKNLKPAIGTFHRPQRFSYLISILIFHFFMVFPESFVQMAVLLLPMKFKLVSVVLAAIIGHLKHKMLYLIL